MHVLHHCKCGLQTAHKQSTSTCQGANSAQPGICDSVFMGWCSAPGVCAGSCLKSGVLSSSGSSSRSDLASDFRAVSTHVASALSRHQQQAAALNSQLASYQATQQQLQQQLTANEAQMRELRDCLGAAEASKQVAVQGAVAQTEACYGKRLLKVEAKVLGMVSMKVRLTAKQLHTGG